MIDFGFDKLALIGAVALIVIGPEKLPRVARTVGHFIGKAQRYVNDVKAEVNRSIELEELQKMKSEFETAARDVEQTVSSELRQTSSELESTWSSAMSDLGTPLDNERCGTHLHPPGQELARQARRGAPVVQAAPGCARACAVGCGPGGPLSSALRGRPRAEPPVAPALVLL